MSQIEIRHFHLACGLGGGAKGFNMASPRARGMVGRMRCIGGIDVDPAAIRDFERATGTKGTVLDLFSRDQYIAFHGLPPPQEWREATPADLRRAAGNERPHIVFASYPCKGNSGLLSEKLSRTGKYQALNSLALRGTWLMLEAWGDDPPELILFENVPRIVQRSRALLDQIAALLASYGYAVAETAHNCGELGGLAQSRKRFLMVARHVEKVPPFLYEPHKRALSNVGDVLGRMPLPGDAAGGPMHRVPRLQWKTWIRLAFVEAGRDWRSLNGLVVENGVLRDYLIMPEMRNGSLGVVPWACAAGTVTGNGRPMAGAFSVADPRHNGPAKHSNEFRIVPWERETGAVTGAHGTGQCVADPRFPAGGQYGQLGVRSWCEATGTVTGQRSPIQGGFSVADPRPGCAHLFSKYAVTHWDARTGTVIGGDDSGAYAVADPRLGLHRAKGDDYLTAGHYGVVPWDRPCGAVSSAGSHDNGRWSVADPRLPHAHDKLVCVIRATDGTWHRPFTTLELAALQSLVEPEEYLELDGLSDTEWRERIGNAVPPHAAAAIAEVMGTTLLLAWSGETFMLSATPIWVRPVAVALSVSQQEDGRMQVDLEARWR